MTSAIPCTSPLQPLHHFSCAPLDTLTVLYLYYTESICAVRKAAELGSVGIKFSRLELRRINFAQVSVLVPKEMPTQQHNVPQTKNGLGKPSRIGQCCVDVPAVLQSVFSTAFLLSIEQSYFSNSCSGVSSATPGLKGFHWVWPSKWKLFGVWTVLSLVNLHCQWAETPK